MRCSVEFLTLPRKSTFAIQKNNCYRSTTLLFGLRWTIYNRQILLVAHNGSVFDRPRFIQFLKNNNALYMLLNKEQIYFGDSLPPCRKNLKSYISSRNLCNVYQFLFLETFEAHDALADVLHSVGFVCSSFIQMCSQSK